MHINHSLQISASGLSAQRLRMDTISNNLANANTTRTEKGGAYKRQHVTFAPMFENALAQRMHLSHSHPQHFLAQNSPPQGGVKVVSTVESQEEGRMVYEPDHPDANEQGYVEYPNVNIVTEMTDMMSANRSYEANVTAIQTLKSMAIKALEMGRA